MSKSKYLLTVALSGLLLACSPPTTPQNNAKSEAEAVETGTVETGTVETVAKTEQTETQRLNDFFQEQFQFALNRSPMFKSYLGMRDEDYGKWDNPSLKYSIESNNLRLAAFEQMQAEFDFDKLEPNAKLSWRLAEYNAAQTKRQMPFMDYSYSFNQMFGVHSQIPAFLINQHQIRSEQDAKDYVSRLQGVAEYLGGNIENTRRRFENGIHPPEFVYDRVIDAAQNIITGAPFSGDDDSPIFADFKKKLDKLDASDELKTELLTAAKTAILSSIGPAYTDLIAEMQQQKQTAGTDDGVWKLPNGEAYYASRLQAMTTTDMTPAQIHDLGLSEVARIHDEMREIIGKVNFDGDLSAFMVFMREDPQFYYPNTDEGKAEYLAKATEYIDIISERLDEIFITKPKAKLIVKAVEPFREATAGKAFYQRPAIDGSRPGTYYANLYNMKSMPTYQMEALAYHEGNPGHHMQLSIAQELTDVPMFRKMGGYTAYSEGWGLYSELIPKEMGFYEDPYSDFGRLAMELWRAARLVVDTGLHDKRWTRQQAIDYLVNNTPNSVADSTSAIERYIVMPGQATAYKIGMLKIQELRARAKQQLGDKFDIREFHDLILAGGPVPLAVLDDIVNEWIAKTKAE